MPTEEQALDDLEKEKGRHLTCDVRGIAGSNGRP